MRTFALHLLLWLSFPFFSELHAQLSPGDLTTAHADLEGMANCTKCHTLGEKVSNAKCLDCHQEIKSRMDRRTGYHASREVTGKECADCHSEHHGRNFDMVRFDEDNFNHRLTGYDLTGAHNKIDCRQCHIPDFIGEPELKKRKDTFLGLDQDCAACHQDHHLGTLSNDCAQCHTTDAFAPAGNFDHARTDFPLLGRHTEVDCIECHREEIRNGKEFQVFAGLEFANCNACHEDAHQNHLGGDCKQCHSEESFSSLSRIRRFNHSQTRFPLKGAHQRVNCADCHNMEASPLSIFQDRLGIRTNDCISCHEDVHDNRFGTNCAECHNENAFRQVDTDQFNHNLTDFALRGKHQTVDCRECHTSNLIDPLPHNDCAACHVDYHEGEFLTAGAPPRDCAACHSEEGFDIPLYTLEDHNKSDFPLEGAHIATPCFACHLDEGEEKWRFRNIGERCVDCHEDVHAGYIDEKYYPGQSCETCHVADSWTTNHFDHNLTDFALLGAHAAQDCMACHGVDEESHPNRYEGFVDLSPVCAGCHEEEHHRQFEQKGVTDCARCHGFDNWTIGDFNHDNTAFKLEGRHAEIECGACHKPVEAEGEVFIQYKFESFECIDCHS